MPEGDASGVGAFRMADRGGALPGPVRAGGHGDPALWPEGLSGIPEFLHEGREGGICGEGQFPVEPAGHGDGPSVLCPAEHDRGVSAWGKAGDGLCPPQDCPSARRGFEGAGGGESPPSGHQPSCEQPAVHRYRHGLSAGGVPGAAGAGGVQEAGVPGRCAGAPGGRGRDGRMRIPGRLRGDALCGGGVHQAGAMKGRKRHRGLSCRG